MLGQPGNWSVERRGVTLYWLAGFLAVLLLATALLIWSQATRKVDRLIYDAFVRATQREAPSDIVIAAIDSTSLEQLGRWPWPRDLQSLLFEQLARHGARMVVADLIYTERSEPKADDKRLATAFEALPLSLLPVLTEGGIGSIGGERLPIPRLLSSVTDIGHIFLPLDDDGIVRRIHLRAGFRKPHWPTLSLAALRAVDPDKRWKTEDLPGRRTELPDDARSRWVQDNEVLIPFIGPNRSFRHVSAVDIIKGTVASRDIRDKLVFVGLTSSGLGDVVPTPVSALDQPLPGVEVHANVLTALRDGRLVTEANPWLGVLLALFMLPMMLLVYSRSSPQWALIATVVGSLFPIAFSWLLYRQLQIWYPPVAVGVVLLIGYLLWSRHRLEFVNRFLESESAKLDAHVPMGHRNDNEVLADFFDHAMRHLPINGWQFSAGGDRYQGGVALGELPEPTVDRWRIEGTRLSRRYPQPSVLDIDVRVDEAAWAEEVAAYIDTLSRVQTRSHPSRFDDSIERLQSNAEELSRQMRYLRGVKVFSETILAGSPIGFMIWNAAGEMLRGNDLVHQMLPTLSDKALFIDFVRAVGRHPRRGDDRQRFRDLLLRGKPWQISWQEGRLELVVSFNAVGDTIATRLICASLVDVSDIRTAERARAEMVDYLSHDLRSPLISALYLVEEDAIKSIDPVERNQRIERNIQQSLRMMDDLLNIARADSLTEDHFEEVLFNAVLDNALDGLLPQARASHIRFVVDTSDEELWIDGHAASLERAVINVVGNAIKYSDPGSVVSITLRRDHDRIVLTVDDEGVGIDPDIVDHVFTRFRRDARTSQRFQGIGLGLALVYRVVTQHGGRVAASTAGRQGTRLTIELPTKVE